MVLLTFLVILINTQNGFLVFAEAESFKMSDLSSVLSFYLLVVHPRGGEWGGGVCLYVGGGAGGLPIYGVVRMCGPNSPHFQSLVYE